MNFKNWNDPKNDLSCPNSNSYVRISRTDLMLIGLHNAKRQADVHLSMVNRALDNKTFFLMLELSYLVL